MSGESQIVDVLRLSRDLARAFLARNRPADECRSDLFIFTRRGYRGTAAIVTRGRYGDSDAMALV